MVITRLLRLFLLAVALTGLAACQGSGSASTATDAANLAAGDGAKPGATAAADSAGGITISWDKPLSNVDGTVLNDLAGYRIYWGTAPGIYTHAVQVADPSVSSYALPQLPAGTYYIATTAYDDEANEGPYSEIARVVID